MKTYEHDEQVAIFQWADAYSVEYPELMMLHAIPNGGMRNVTVAVKLKAEGTKAGVPDMQLPVARGQWHSLWIELKVGKNKLREEQKEWIRRLQFYGNKAMVCYGADEAIAAIREYLGMKGGQP